MRYFYAVFAAAIALAPLAAHANEGGGWSIGGRIENQGDRIGAGLSQGQLGVGQAAALAGADARIAREAHALAGLNGGKLSGWDRAVLNAQLNVVSGLIFDARHEERGHDGHGGHGGKH